MPQSKPQYGKAPKSKQVPKVGLWVPPVKSKWYCIGATGRMLCWGKCRANRLNNDGSETARGNHMKNPFNKPQILQVTVLAS